jgi:hypothetical protein
MSKAQRFSDEVLTGLLRALAPAARAGTWRRARSGIDERHVLGHAGQLAHALNLRWAGRKTDLKSVLARGRVPF